MCELNLTMSYIILEGLDCWQLKLAKQQKELNEKEKFYSFFFLINMYRLLQKLESLFFIFLFFSLFLITFYSFLDLSCKKERNEAHCKLNILHSFVD